MVFDVNAFIRAHGIVLASAKGPVPSVAEAVAGAPIRGSWWSHAKGKAIFAALSAVDEDAVLCCRLVGGKITFVHRRLWPALVRLSDAIGRDALARVQQEHTSRGKHRNVVTPFEEWVSPTLRKEATKLSEREARAELSSCGLLVR